MVVCTSFSFSSFTSQLHIFSAFRFLLPPRSFTPNSSIKLLLPFYFRSKPALNSPLAHANLTHCSANKGSSGYFIRTHCLVTDCCIKTHPKHTGLHNKHLLSLSQFSWVGWAQPDGFLFHMVPNVLAGIRRLKCLWRFTQCGWQLLLGAELEPISPPPCGPSSCLGFSSYGNGVPGGSTPSTWTQKLRALKTQSWKFYSKHFYFLLVKTRANHPCSGEKGVNNLGHF